MALFSEQNLFVIVLGIWLLFLMGGRYQLNRIKKNTVDIVLSEAKKVVSRTPPLNLSSFYHDIYPIWVDMVRKSAYFVPHKSELFPIPARPDAICARINFSADWVGAFLEKNGYEVSATPEQRQKIKAILATGAKRGARGSTMHPPYTTEKNGD